MKRIEEELAKITLLLQFKVTANSETDTQARLLSKAVAKGKKKFDGVKDTLIIIIQDL